MSTVSAAPQREAAESLSRKPDLLHRCVAESLGTFFLVLIGPGAAVVNAATGALTHVGVFAWCD